MSPMMPRFGRFEAVVAGVPLVMATAAYLSQLYPLLMYWIAAHGGALGDTTLEAWDRAIHSPAVALAVFDRRHPALHSGTKLVSSSLQAGGILALIALPLTNRVLGGRVCGLLTRRAARL
jgi:hypothetical protein